MVAKHDNDALGSCDPHGINSTTDHTPDPIGCQGKSCPEAERFRPNSDRKLTGAGSHSDPGRLPRLQALCLRSSKYLQTGLHNPSGTTTNISANPFCSPHNELVRIIAAPSNSPRLSPTTRLYAGSSTTRPPPRPAFACQPTHCDIARPRRSSHRDSRHLLGSPVPKPLFLPCWRRSAATRTPSLCAGTCS